jgi:PEGA domain
MNTQMKRILITLLVSGAVLTATTPASAAVVFRGGFVVGRPWGWHGPVYYAPYGFYAYAPYGFSGPYLSPNVGEVKLDTKVKDAEVFINGAYAGTAGKLKSMWMVPAPYDLEIRAAGCMPFSERIYVVAGKTLHVHPDLRIEAIG